MNQNYFGEYLILERKRGGLYMNDNSCCINNILEVINVLQNQAEKIDDIQGTCDRPFLGLANGTNTFVYNYK